MLHSRRNILRGNLKREGVGNSPDSRLRSEHKPKKKRTRTFDE